jgi:hypothetical protein
MDNSQLTNVFVMLSFVFIIKLFQKMIIEKINNYFFQVPYKITKAYVLALASFYQYHKINVINNLLIDLGH